MLKACQTGRAGEEVCGPLPRGRAGVPVQRGRAGAREGRKSEVHSQEVVQGVQFRGDVQG